MTRRPKILHTMTWLAPGGGADRNVYLSMRDMRQKYDLHLAVGHQIHRRDFLDLEGITVHICPHLDRNIHPWRDLRALLWFIALIRRERFDIVHTHETKASLIGRVAAWIARCPRIIYGLHGVVFNDPLSRLHRLFYLALEKTTVPCAHRIVAVSKDAVNHYHNHNIARNKPCHIVYSGIDIDQFQQGMIPEQVCAFRKQFNLPENAKILVNIGRFSKAKAQHFTISAFAQLRSRHPDLHLLLVGEGSERAACEQQCRDLGIDQHVTFTGFCENVAPAYAVATINVLTSLREGLPGVVVEAALASVPTVAFDVEGIAEIITHGHSGYIVPQYDVEALTEHIHALLSNPTQCNHLGDQAWAHAIKHWSHHTMVNDLDAIYTDMLSKKTKQTIET